MRTMQSGVFAITPDDRQVVMVHPGTAVIEIGSQALDFVHITVGCGRNSMDAQTLVALLYLY